MRQQQGYAVRWQGMQADGQSRVIQGRVRGEVMGSLFGIGGGDRWWLAKRKPPGGMQGGGWASPERAQN